MSEERASRRAFRKVRGAVADPLRPEPVTCERSSQQFECFQCGSTVPGNADKCPGCGIHYLRDVSECAIEELSRAEAEEVGQLEEFVPRSENPVIHFDAETGAVDYVDGSARRSDRVVECGACGTQIKLDTGTCPMCGAALEDDYTGLGELFEDMEFDREPLIEADCPFCGEHVSLADGRCPACGAAIEDQRAKDVARRVFPLVRGSDVIFLHLDVDTGELSLLHRLADRLGMERISLCLNGNGKDRSEEDRRSLSGA